MAYSAGRTHAKSSTGLRAYHIKRRTHSTAQHSTALITAHHSTPQEQHVTARHTHSIAPCQAPHDALKGPQDKRPCPDQHSTTKCAVPTHATPPGATIIVPLRLLGCDCCTAVALSWHVSRLGVLQAPPGDDGVLAPTPACMLAAHTVGHGSFGWLQRTFSARQP